MAIPDYLLVYGKFWKELLIKNGFWEEMQVISVGSSRMDRYRNRIYKQKTRKESTEILFTSQWTTRENAIKFWNRFLTLLKKNIIHF